MKVTNNPNSWPGKYYKSRSYDNHRVIFLGEITQRVTYSENPGSLYALYICRESEGHYKYISSMTLCPPPFLTSGAKTYAALVAKNISYSLSGKYDRLIRDRGLYCWAKKTMWATFEVVNVSSFIKATINEEKIQQVLQNALETTLRKNRKRFDATAIRKNLNRLIYRYGIQCKRISEGEQVLSYDNLPPSCQLHNQQWLDKKEFRYQTQKRKEDVETTIHIIKRGRHLSNNQIRKGLAIEKKDPNSLNNPRTYQD